MKTYFATSSARNSGPPPYQPGPGLHLKAMLASFGLSETEACGCGPRVAQMERWGVAGCREHRAEIVGWLVEGAQKRGADVDAAGVAAIVAVVDEAIRRAHSEAD